MTRKAYQTRKKRGRKGDDLEYPFYPNHVLRSLIVAVAAAALVVFLAGLFPPSLDQAADPLASPDSGIDAIWILKPVIVVGKIVRSRAITSSFITFLLLGFLLVPVFDRTGKSSLRNRVNIAVPFLLLIAWLVLSIFLPVGGPG